MKNKEYKNSELYEQYNQLHINDQIPFLRENNEVVGDLEYWLIIKNKFHDKQYTAFTKLNNVVYREDLTLEPNFQIAMLELDQFILTHNLHLHYMYINAWKDRSIKRFHFHIKL